MAEDRPVFSGMSLSHLERVLVRLLVGIGMRQKDARPVAWAYTVMTGRAIGHHDVSGFPGLLSRLEKGTLAARPNIRVVKDSAAVAVLDGDGAPGPLAAYRTMECALRKARSYGVGFACVRNSSHFLGAAPYALLAAQHGMIGIAASNTIPTMGTGASADRAIGNNPWGFSAPGENFPFLFDICNAYASYGKLHQYAAAGWKIPDCWGLDRRGKPTTDPKEVLDKGVPLPVAGHKGFGISVLVELLTAALSGGALTDEILENSRRGDNFSQAALALDIRRFLPVRRFRLKAGEMERRLKAHPLLDEDNPTLLPGERSFRALQRIKEQGVALSESTVIRLNEWCRKLNIGPEGCPARKER